MDTYRQSYIYRETHGHLERVKSCSGALKMRVVIFVLLGKMLKFCCRYITLHNFVKNSIVVYVSNETIKLIIIDNIYISL